VRRASGAFPERDAYGLPENIRAEIHDQVVTKKRCGIPPAGHQCILSVAAGDLVLWKRAKIRRLLMDHAEAVAFVRKAQREGVPAEYLLRFLDAYELAAEFLARSGAVSPKRPDYAD
jgi:hypothetical protein